jgi:hypothetical protein
MLQERFALHELSTQPNQTILSLKQPVEEGCLRHPLRPFTGLALPKTVGTFSEWPETCAAAQLFLER